MAKPKDEDDPDAMPDGFIREFELISVDPKEVKAKAGVKTIYTFKFLFCPDEDDSGSSSITMTVKSEDKGFIRKLFGVVPAVEDHILVRGQLGSLQSKLIDE